MPEANKYQPMTPDEREKAVLDSREKPYYEEFKSIVLAAEMLAVMVSCDDHEHSKDDLRAVAAEVFDAIQTCLPAAAISALDTDDCATAPERMEGEFGGKIQ